MIATTPEVIPDGRYELKEAARALGVDKSTLCRYRKEGLIKATIRKSNKRFLYSGSEIIRLWKALM